MYKINLKDEKTIKRKAVFEVLIAESVFVACLGMLFYWFMR